MHAKHEKSGPVTLRSACMGAWLLCHAGRMNCLLAHAGISGLPCINLLQAFVGMQAKSHVLSRVCGKCVWLQGSIRSSGCFEQTLLQSADLPRDPRASCPGALVCTWLMSRGRLFISQRFVTRRLRCLHTVHEKWCSPSCIGVSTGRAG